MRYTTAVPLRIAQGTRIPVPTVPKPRTVRPHPRTSISIFHIHGGRPLFPHSPPSLFPHVPPSLPREGGCRLGGRGRGTKRRCRKSSEVDPDSNTGGSPCAQVQTTDDLDARRPKPGPETTSTSSTGRSRGQGRKVSLVSGTLGTTGKRKREDMNRRSESVTFEVRWASRDLDPVTEITLFLRRVTAGWYCLVFSVRPGVSVRDCG